MAQPPERWGASQEDNGRWTSSDEAEAEADANADAVAAQPVGNGAKKKGGVRARPGMSPEMALASSLLNSPQAARGPARGAGFRFDEQSGVADGSLSPRQSRQGAAETRVEGERGRGRANEPRRERGLTVGSAMWLQWRFAVEVEQLCLVPCALWNPYSVQPTA